MTAPELRSPLQVAPGLRAAYASTHYEVETCAGPKTLRVGEASPPIPLEGGLMGGRVAIVTAWNPFSQPLAAAQNAARNARLKAEVERVGRRHLPARGRDPSGEWPPEESLAIVDPTDEELDGWMFLFGQNAVVLADAAGVARLRFHPHEASRHAEHPYLAQRCAAVLWVRAWNELDAELLALVLHPEVVHESRSPRAVRRGPAAVLEDLRAQLQLLGAASTPGVRGELRSSQDGRPYAFLIQRSGPSAVLFQVQRGLVRRIDERPPSESSPSFRAR
jgi:hypothetical protein